MTNMNEQFKVIRREERTMVDEKKVKEVFKLICQELSTRTDRVYQDMYQVIQKKR